MAESDRRLLSTLERLLEMEPMRVEAFENVLSNATKHSPRNGTVRVHVDPVQLAGANAVRVTIVDQGSGISPEIIPHIFERYVSSGPAAGLGLGLHLARAVVVAHGGSIKLDSQASRGTRCEIVLPLVPPEP